MTSKNTIKEYYSVGEVAKKANVTVRTLQYYDKQGLLRPSAESEGGRRLYTGQDIVKLYQILSLKKIGFSLADIKERLPRFETTEEVIDLLNNQSETIRSQITSLVDNLGQIEKLRAEIRQINEVDWDKYVNILAGIQEECELYGIIKYFDDKVINHMQNIETDKAHRINEKQNELWKLATELYEANKSPESEECKQLAQNWWNVLTDFADGNTSIMNRMMENLTKINQADLGGIKPEVYQYLGNVMDAYFKTGKLPYTLPKETHILQLKNGEKE